MKYFHRTTFYLLLLFSLVWACLALKVNVFEILRDFEIVESLKLIFILSCTVIFWPIFYIEVIDYIESISGKNGKLYKDCAMSMRKDIVVSLIAAVVLGSIYWLDIPQYSFSGIDVGYVGFPFLLYSIYTIIQMRNIKVAGRSIKKLPMAGWLSVVVVFAIVAYLILLKNSSGAYEPYQAIWFQLTILFGSFFFFTNVNYQNYFLEKGKIELSKFKKYFFIEVLMLGSSPYVRLDDSIKRINKKTLQDKAKYSSMLRKKGRKRD